MTASVLAIVEDLIFLAKIQQAAQQLGITITSANPAKVEEAMAGAAPSAVLVDLNHRSGLAVEMVRTLKASPATSGIPVVGFVSHVQSDLINAARAAGCNQVLARSVFSRDLPQLLAKLTAQPASKP